MKVSENKGITAAKGFKASGVACDIKASGKKDLAIVYSEQPANVTAAFTTNSIAAAAVILCRELLLATDKTQAVVINSGNANSCTGQQGYLDAQEMSRLTADKLGLSGGVLVASTGIIGEPLPMDKVRFGIEQAAAVLSSQGGGDAAEAIMTTDAFKKEIAVEVEIGDKLIRIGGMAKGAGMIGPQLIPHATMIAVVTTDIAISSGLLRSSLEKAINKSFNRSTVDGDTSTNDSVFLLANGTAGNVELNMKSKPSDIALFQAALEYILIELAKKIVRDGEGATKLINYKITGARSEVEAAKIGMRIANSLLVKTAFFGRDPNWGRILAAAGSAGVALSAERISLYFGQEQLVKDGQALDYNEDKLGKILSQPEIDVILDIGMGGAEAVCFGCDLSYEYVKINAAYRT